MKRLAYGILRDRGPIPPLDPTTTGGPPIVRVAAEGLAVAYSRVPPEELAPNLTRLQEYARVVEALHRRETILPLRYGSLLDTEADIDSLLRRNRAVWMAALDRVEGCEEMGLRVLLHGAHSGNRPTPPPGPVDPQRPGASYLAARRSRFAALDTLGAEAARASERIQQAFHGRYRDCRVAAISPDHGGMLSLAFLIRRDDLDRFRRAFQQLLATNRDSVLLTGPWPPYHFADAVRVHTP